MFVKHVILFCFYYFLIGTVTCQMSNDMIIDVNMTQESYNKLKGPDLCGQLKNNVETQKKACNEVAIREEMIKSAESSPLLAGYPKCSAVTIQLYVCDGHDCKKGTTIQDSLLECSYKGHTFTIGKGWDKSDIVMYKCKSQACNAWYAMGGVFSS